MNGRYALVAICAATCLLVSCKRDPAEVEAEKVASDKSALTDPVSKDLELNGLLLKADKLAEAGDDQNAVALLQNEAMPVADQALAAAMAIRPQSAWGIAHVRELTDFVRARKESLPPYIASLQGEDLDAKLAATETQLAMEQRAMLVIAHMNGELETVTLPDLSQIPRQPLPRAAPIAAPISDAAALRFPDASAPPPPASSSPTLTTAPPPAHP